MKEPGARNITTVVSRQTCCFDASFCSQVEGYNTEKSRRNFASPPRLTVRSFSKAPQFSIIRESFLTRSENGRGRGEMRSTNQTRLCRLLVFFFGKGMFSHFLQPSDQYGPPRDVASCFAFWYSKYLLVCSKGHVRCAFLTIFFYMCN